MNFGEVRKARQNHSPHLHAGDPAIFSYLLMSIQMLKREREREREWGAESNGKPSLVPEIAVEDLPLGRTTVLVPEFSVKDLPLGKTL